MITATTLRGGEDPQVLDGLGTRFSRPSIARRITSYIFTTRLRRGGLFRSHPPPILIEIRQAFRRWCRVVVGIYTSGSWEKG